MKDSEEFARPPQRAKPAKNSTPPKIVDVFAPTQLILEGDLKSPTKPSTGSNPPRSPPSNNSEEKKAEDNEEFDGSGDTQKIEEDEVPQMAQKVAKTSWSLVSEAIKGPQKAE